MTASLNQDFCVRVWNYFYFFVLQWSWMYNLFLLLYHCLINTPGPGRGHKTESCFSFTCVLKFGRACLVFPRFITDTRGLLTPFPIQFLAPFLANFTTICSMRSLIQPGGKEAARWSEDKGEETGGRLDATRQIAKNTTTAATTTATPTRVRVATLHLLYQARPSSQYPWYKVMKHSPKAKIANCPLQDLFWDAQTILSHHYVDVPPWYLQMIGKNQANPPTKKHQRHLI